MVPDPRMAATMARLARGTEWVATGQLPLMFDAGHPQGMVRVDGVWWISTVDLAHRRGYVLAVDGAGELVERVPVGDEVRFHPGGMDHDGQALWVACSEYRPRSSAIIERLVLGEGSSEPAFAVDDHVGAVVRLGPTGELVGWTWGSRRLLRWDAEGTVLASRWNPGHFVDHQDGQWLGGDLVACAGVATVQLAAGVSPLGGIGLLDAAHLTMVCEAPFPRYAPSGRVATQNPIFIEAVDDTLVAHLLPDDGQGMILSYATPLRPA